jgi:hypothetical protein
MFASDYLPVRAWHGKEVIMTDIPKFYFILYEEDERTVKEGSVDVTELIKSIYDIVTKSLDWGSEMLDFEDTEAVAKLAIMGHFEGWNEAQARAADMLHSVEAAAFQKSLPRRPSHLHIFHTAGEGYERITDTCQVPLCDTSRGNPIIVREQYVDDLWEGKVYHPPVLSTVNRCMYPRHIKGISDHEEEK